MTSRAVEVALVSRASQSARSLTSASNLRRRANTLRSLAGHHIRVREYDAVTGAAVQALEISRALGLGKYVDLLREVRAQAPADEPALAELDEALRSA